MVVQIPIQSIQVPPGQRVLLQDVGWEEFEAILEELGDRGSVRVAYYDGTLEIMTPLPEHEYFKETLSDAIKDMAETLELDYESYGSTTWRRQAKQAGLEADSGKLLGGFPPWQTFQEDCFYFENEASVRGRLDINLAQDPPPDLALEVDLTNKSLERFPIYARLGVPELWCYDDGKLKVYRLEGEQYVEVEQSSVFPQLDVRAVPQLIEENRSAGRLALPRAVRVWVRQCSI